MKKDINKPKYRNQGPPAIQGGEILLIYHTNIGINKYYMKKSSDIRKSRLCSAQSVSDIRSKGCRIPDEQSDPTQILTSSWRFGQAASCSSYRLVSQRALLKESLQIAIEWQSTITFVFSVTHWYCY